MLPTTAFPRSRGFTLIELMVVILVIGVILTFAIINLGGRQDPRLENEARRLASVLDLARETAVIRGRELGLMIDAEGYRFAWLEDGEWQVVSGDGDRVLRPQPLPDDIDLQWVADGLPGQRSPGQAQTQSQTQSQTRGQTADGGGEDARPQPVILLLSSGELTPFQLTLGWRDGRQRQGWLLEGSLMGKLSLTHREDLRP